MAILLSIYVFECDAIMLAPCILYDVLISLLLVFSNASNFGFVVKDFNLAKHYLKIFLCVP